MGAGQQFYLESLENSECGRTPRWSQRRLRFEFMEGLG
jgi:hypothetical protein